MNHKITKDIFHCQGNLGFFFLKMDCGSNQRDLDSLGQLLGQVGIQFHLQVSNNKFLPFWGVFSHVKLKKLLNAHLFFQNNGVKPYVFSNKLTEFVGADFTQSLESSYFAALSQFFDGRNPFLGVVTIPGFFLVAHSKQGGLQNKKVS